MKLVSAYYSESDPFLIFDGVTATCDPRDLEEGDVLILWGGEDISPSLYGEVPVYSEAGPTPSKRDVIEANLYKEAIKKGIPVIGVCRGAQLACALSGGTLYQHIEGGHHSSHEVTTFDGNVFKTSSCHHQALNLTNVPSAEVLAWDKGRTVRAFTQDSVENVVIPEVVWFSETNTLAIQGHPEWMNPTSPFVKWCSKLIKERMFKHA